MLNGRPTLAYCARSLPGDASAAASFLEAEGLAAELADDGELDVDYWARTRVPVCIVQAHWLHDLHPLLRDDDAVARSVDRLAETLDAAVALQAPRVLVVLGFGDVVADDAHARAVDFVKAAAEGARARHLRLLVEPLAPSRCAALGTVEEVLDVIRAVDAPDAVELAVDTGHLHASSRDVAEALATARTTGVELGALQLKGPDSEPPAADLPLAAWLACDARPPAVVSFEHNRPAELAHSRELVRTYRAQLREIG